MPRVDCGCMPSERRYCADRARAYDYDRYFASVLAPPEVRAGLNALYAFNLEIASTRERVSEAAIGEMRLQWWRDAVGEIYAGREPAHAVAIELARAIELRELPRDAFERMIDARSLDLCDAPPEDLSAVEGYAAATAGELAALAFRVCESAPPPSAVAQAGTAWGLAGLLRAAPHHAAEARVMIPRDAPSETGVRPEDLASVGSLRSAGPAAAPMARRTRELLQASRGELRRIGRAARPAFCYLGAAALYLERLRKSGDDPFAAGLEPSRLVRQLAVVRAGFTGRV